MSGPADQLLLAFDGHDVEGIRSALDSGADAVSPVRGKEPVYWLLEEYTRSDRLPECLRLLFESGATLNNRAVEAVLLDDAASIRSAIDNEPSAVGTEVSLVSAFTSLEKVTLLHVAAEYGNLTAARTLLELGADVNAAAGTDSYGLGGHTPIFHTVNSNRNRSEPIMRSLIAAGSDCTLQLQGLYWGRGYPWETVFFDVTPVSYAQMGVMPQMHRLEADVYSNVASLVQAAGRSLPQLSNVPNRYLHPKGV